MSKIYGRYRNYEEPMETVMDDVEIMDEDASMEPVYGYVANCSVLNIRNKPNGDIVTLAKSGSKLMIDEHQSTNEWLSVYTEDGVNGFCMKKFVDISK